MVYRVLHGVIFIPEIVVNPCLRLRQKRVVNGVGGALQKTGRTVANPLSRLCKKRA
jgi:hypothetical protein